MIDVIVRTRLATDRDNPALLMELCDLRPADMFLFEGLLYLKSASGFSVNLHTGKIEYLVPSQLVIKVYDVVLTGEMKA